MTSHRPVNYIPWENRIRLEINYKRDCFGAGGAGHNQMGIHDDIDHFEEMYDKWITGLKTIHHMFYYELGRNYWYSVMNPISHRKDDNISFHQNV